MYGSSQTKSWLPYEWLDCADRLHYDGLSLNRCWFSKLKNEFVLLLEEYKDCQQVFREQGMRTFDWMAGVLQQSGCQPLPGSTRKKERILLRALCRHFRRRCVTPGCVHAVSSLRDASR